MSKKHKKLLTRIFATAALLAVLNFIPVSGLIRTALFAAVYLLIGFDVIRKAISGIISGHIFGENFLMSIASLGAFAIAAWNQSGDFNEAVAVMLLYQTGELLQALAVRKSRKNIASLMDIRPDSATLLVDGKTVTVNPEEVNVGSIILVKAGEKIPLDGTVTAGASSIDTAALTGESLPRDVSAGDSVVSGCICLDGVLEIRVEKPFAQSTVSKILALCEDASWNKSRSENFITKFSKIYTPAVCAAAAAVALVPPAVILLLGGSATFADWIYRALTMLVISCPCALVISVPLTFFASIGGASRQGVLVKGSNFLEAMSKAEYAVFDKTGTLTMGEFEVKDIHPESTDAGTLLELAALTECSSSHPIAKSILRAFGREVNRARVQNITETAGYGVSATVDGRPVHVGNRRMMAELGLTCTPPVEGAVFVACDGIYMGYITAADTVKSSAAEAVAELKRLGIRQTVMLTGDGDSNARAVGEALAVDTVKSGLLPADKVWELEKLLNAKRKGSTLFYVGDGINDAPVLARADIGVAMGAMGADAAIEAADIVLMDDDPHGLVKAMRIAKKCMAIVRQNVVFSLGVKLLCMVLGALGVASMWLAIFADVGVMLLAILNSIRALRP